MTLTTLDHAPVGNVIDNGDTGSQPRAPYSVDTSKGSVRGDVSAQWAARPHDQKFDTLGDLYNFKRRLWELSHDAILASAELQVTSPSLDFERGDLTDAQVAAEVARRTQHLALAFKVADGGDVQRVIEAAPTHYAFSQLASYANFSGRELRKLPTPIAADVLNWQLRHNSVNERVKLWYGEDQARAVQGPAYGRIADHELVAALMGLAGDGKGEDPRYHWKAPGRLNWSNGTYDPEDIGPVADRTFYASDRDMFCFLVDDRRPIVVGTTRDGKPDHLFRGFYVQNSMVGARALKVATFYLRGVCMNRNLWGVEKFSEITIRHTSGAPERWLEQAKPALESFAQGSDQTVIEGVQRAKAKVLADSDKAAMDYLRKRQGFSEQAAAKIIKTSEAEEGRKPRTVWDFGQAVTAYARDLPNTDTRLDVELIGKRVLDLVA